jgi:hypothetical protein
MNAKYRNTNRYFRRPSVKRLTLGWLQSSDHDLEPLGERVVNFRLVLDLPGTNTAVTEVDSDSAKEVAAMTVASAAAKPIPWWREPTKDQWMAWCAAWLGWMLDAFDFTMFLLIMVDRGAC